MKKALRATGIFCLLVVSSICYAQVQQDWARKFVGSGADNAAGIAADNSGNVWICGNNNWGYSTADMYAVRYNSAGTQTAGYLYNSPYNNADQGKAIATDPAGNVYVAGKASVNSSTSDIVVIKYNSSAVQQWVTIFNTPQSYIDDVNAIAVDAAGNVYLTGSIVKGAFEYDYLTIKFNTSGVLLWYATYNGPVNGVDIANDIAVDAQGNVYITGLSAGQVRSRTSPTGYVNSGYDYATIKYNSSGAQLWAARYNYFLKNDEAKSIAVDASGNVYVTGIANNASNYQDCVTIKYTTDGLWVWNYVYVGAGGQHDAGNALAVDGSGNVFIGGYTYNSSGRSDVLALKFNTGGALLWTGIYDAGGGAHDVGKTMGLDAYGNMYIAAETSIPGVTASDYLTIKYTSSGVRSWVARYNGVENGTDYPTAMVVVTPTNPFGGTNNAYIYVTGSSNNDVVTVKYSQPTVIGGFTSAETASPQELLVNNFTISNYPNPLSSFTNIQYVLPADGHVTINVFDVLGRKMATPVNGFRKAGTHVARVNAAELADGVYHYQCTATTGGKAFRASGTMVIKR